MPATTPYDWLKSVERRLVDRPYMAIMELPEEFSWESLAKALAQHFEVPGLTLTPSSATWLTEGTTFQGLQEPVTTLRFAVGSLPGEVQWVIATETLTQMMADLLTGQPSLAPVGDPGFLEGFLNYIVAETLPILSRLGLREALAPRFLGRLDESPSSGKVLSIDVQMALFDRTFPTRLLMAESLVGAWKEHFRRLGRRQELPAALAQQTQLLVHLECGQVTLSQKEWSAIAEGDFLLLDSSTVTPGVEKGRVMFTVGGIPLFRCMLKSGQIKILEHPLYHEVETPMSEKENHDQDDDSFVDEHTDDSFVEHEDDDDDHDENHEFESGELDFEHSESEEDHTDDVSEVEEHEEVSHADEEAPALTPADKIPLTIVVEIGRLKMALSQLRDLQPGKLLDIDVKPEDGVNLTINGACVGRGELLRIGETLGVRILELG